MQNKEIETSQTIQTDKPPKLSLRFIAGWSSTTASTTAAWVFLSYLTMYAADVMGLNITTVGTAIMISKIFDGFTDVIAGIIIDKTHTRWGKARPYTWAVVGMWICVGLLFSAPQMSQFAGVIYLFVLYTLMNAVFVTLYQCAEPPYLANALEDPRQSMTLLSVGGVISTLAGTIFGIAVPLVIARIGNDPVGWRIMGWSFSIPLALVSIIRFFAIKERTNTAKAQSAKNVQKMSVKDIVKVLMANKYIVILAVLVFIAYLGSNMQNAVTSFYAKWIFGDVGLASVMTLTMLPLVVVMAIVPMLARKFTLKRCINVAVTAAMIGSLLRLVAPQNVLLAFIGACFQGIAFPAFYGFASTMVIDCMDYGEWKTGTRVEGTLSSMQSLMNKLGTALGSGLPAIMMGFAGYDGVLEQQSQGALFMIIALATIVPAIFCFIFLLIFRFYDLEARLPAIREELKSRRSG